MRVKDNNKTKGCKCKLSCNLAEQQFCGPARPPRVERKSHVTEKRAQREKQVATNFVSSEFM